MRNRVHANSPRTMRCAFGLQRHHAATKHFTACLAFLFVLATAISAHAAETPSTQTPAPVTALPESSVKAAFLYKFPAYIDWPQPLAAAEPFKIGVLDSLPVEHELQQLALSGSVAGHPITITEVKRHRDLEGLKLLFVGGQSIARYSSLLLDAEKSGIVTVTEAEKTPALESIINFVVEQGRVRFTVSLPAAQRAGVTLSSRLLNVAKSVDRGTP